MNYDNLNSMTKYPSIETYHHMSNGVITEECDPVPCEALFTEKVDGTNARIILMPNADFFIGSREELLYACGDRIINPKEKIVETVLPTAKLAVKLGERIPGSVMVMFGEVYGHRIGRGWKNYTLKEGTGFRLFDVAVVSDWEEVLQKSRSDISTWRKRGGQEWLSEDRLRELSETLDVQLTKRLSLVPPPESHSETLEWLKVSIPETHAKIDSGANGKPEGIVVRSSDRSYIRKIRFEDYRRAIQRCGRP